MWSRFERVLARVRTLSWTLASVDLFRCVSSFSKRSIRQHTHVSVVCHSISQPSSWGDRDWKNDSLTLTHRCAGWRTARGWS